MNIAVCYIFMFQQVWLKVCLEFLPSPETENISHVKNKINSTKLLCYTFMFQQVLLDVFFFFYSSHLQGPRNIKNNIISTKLFIHHVHSLTKQKYTAHITTPCIINRSKVIPEFTVDYVLKSRWCSSSFD